MSASVEPQRQNRLILTLCGSLRAASSNREILRAYERVAPAGLQFLHYEGLALLSHFNPDLDGDPLPTAVIELRRLIAAVDAIVISTPEYAHGLPGAFKNALDWSVSDPAFTGKAVVILHAARGSDWALNSLQEILRTMSARVLDDAQVLLPLGTNRITAEQILGREDLAAALSFSAEQLARFLDHSETSRE